MDEVGHKSILINYYIVIVTPVNRGKPRHFRYIISYLNRNMIKLMNVPKMYSMQIHA